MSSHRRRKRPTRARDTPSDQGAQRYATLLTRQKKLIAIMRRPASRLSTGASADVSAWPERVFHRVSAATTRTFVPRAGPLLPKRVGEAAAILRRVEGVPEPSARAPLDGGPATM